jgi:hypothetical protein
VLRLFRQLGVVVGRWQGGGLEEESEAFETHLNGALHAHTHQTNAESYRPIADVRFTLVPGRRMAAVDGDEDRPGATRMTPVVDA